MTIRTCGNIFQVPSAEILPVLINFHILKTPRQLLTDDFQHVWSDQRLSTGEPDLLHPLADKEAGQCEDLSGGQQLTAWRELHPLLRHAVLT